MEGVSQTARLGKEVVAYLLGAPYSSSSTERRTSSSGVAAGHAAIVPLNNPNASTPLATLRGTTPKPSASSFQHAVSADSSSVLFFHADRERAVIHAHQYHTTAGAAGTRSQTCTVLPLLHPPEPTPTLSLSPGGTLLAAGATSGRLYVWHVASGHLLASLDAHFRAVSCLAWTADEKALVSGSDDSRILVWSTEAIVDGSSSTNDVESDADVVNRPVMPFAILTDHVQGITSLELSSSKKATVASFPSSLRIVSSSRDGTVKLWDVRTRSMVATWAFSGPVLSVAVDVGFRSFFAVVRGRADVDTKPAMTQHHETAADDAEEDAKQDYDWVRRVDLFGGSDVQQTSSTHHETMSRVHSYDTVVHRANTGVRITAIAISVTGSHLIIGTSEASMIIVDVASSVTLRTTSLVAAGQTGLTKSGTSTSGLDVLSLSTFLVDDASSLLQSASMRSGSGGAGGARNPDWPVTRTLDRVVLRQGTAATTTMTFDVRLAQRDVGSLVQRIAPPSLGGRQLRRRANVDSTHENDAELRHVRQKIAQLQHDSVLERSRETDSITKLQHDNHRLKDMVKRLQDVNAGLMKHVA